MSQGERNAMAMERRRHYRAGVGGGVVVHAGGAAMRGHLDNLSLGGALIALDAPHPLAVDHEVIVELEIGGVGWIAQRGHVRRCDGRALAIAFASVRPDVEDLIEDEVCAAVEARRSPRVVVVDPREDRRHDVAAKLRARGCTSMEAATPLEAIALVEQSRNHVAAVAVAETLTQTAPHELVDYLSESNPNIKLAMYVDDAGGGGRVPAHVARAGTSDELASSIAESLRDRHGR